MSWMFSWLENLLARMRRDAQGPHALEKGWVEPSNAITRAVLSGAVARYAVAEVQQPAAPVVVQVTYAVETPVAETAVPEPQTDRAEEPIVVRTARRLRRRRATRAA